MFYISFHFFTTKNTFIINTQILNVCNFIWQFLLNIYTRARTFV